MVAICAIAEEVGIPVQFRIKHTRHTYLIGNLLDLGPLGIEVPQVEEESTVNEAINYFWYSQIGIRSWGGAVRCGVKGRVTGWHTPSGGTEVDPISWTGERPK